MYSPKINVKLPYVLTIRRKGSQIRPIEHTSDDQAEQYSQRSEVPPHARVPYPQIFDIIFSRHSKRSPTIAVGPFFRDICVRVLGICFASSPLPALPHHSALKIKPVHFIRICSVNIQSNAIAKCSAAHIRRALGGSSSDIRTSPPSPVVSRRCDSSDVFVRVARFVYLSNRTEKKEPAEFGETI